MSISRIYEGRSLEYSEIMDDYRGINQPKIGKILRGGMINNSIVKYEFANHRGKDIILIRFEYDAALIERVKKLVGVQWSQSHKAWYVMDSAMYRAKFGLLPKSLIGKEVLSNIHPINQPILQRYIETLQLKAYSPNTINTYRNEFAQLLYILKDKKVDELDADRLRGYFLYCINTLKLSENTIHSRINAIKFYYEQVLGRERMFIEIPRPDISHSYFQKKHLRKLN